MVCSMKIPSTLSLLLLVLCGTAWPSHAAESGRVIQYTGRLTGVSPPFTGAGQFKFALVDPAGQRVWTSGDHEVPIEGSTPSGSVPLQVSRGAYVVRLGDPAAGMKPFGAAVTANWATLALQTWFHDGKGGWEDAGLAPLSGRGSTPGSIAPPAGFPPGGDPDADPQQIILAELRGLRAEVAALRRQLLAEANRSGPPSTSLPQTTPRSKRGLGLLNVSLAEVPRPSLGSADAPVVLVEFTNFVAGSCKSFSEQTFPELKEKYIDTGKLRFVSRQLPIKGHPQCRPTALALLCAAAQDPGQYWAMRGWLFEHSKELNEAAYATYVKGAGLDLARFHADLTAERHGPELDEDVAAALATGIPGAPSFVLGTSDGKTIEGERIVGAKSSQVFASKIEALLAAHAEVNPAVTETPGPTQKTK
jgi:protein-disulfide isomerase